MPAYGIILALPTLLGVMKAAENAEVQKLQGKWQLVAIEIGEEKHMYDDKEEKQIISIRGRKWLSSEDARDDDVTYNLNPLAEPKQINLTFTKWGSFSSLSKKHPATLPGIYSLNGDMLKVCIDIPISSYNSSKPVGRPTAFTGKPDLIFQTLKRIRD
jgi:uncharacterized protein (TIGR03067 family)